MIAINVSVFIMLVSVHVYNRLKKLI